MYNLGGNMSNYRGTTIEVSVFDLGDGFLDYVAHGAIVRVKNNCISLEQVAAELIRLFENRNELSNKNV
jgi:hypothetical protein